MSYCKEVVTRRILIKCFECNLFVTIDGFLQIFQLEYPNKFGMLARILLRSCSEHLSIVEEADVGILLPKRITIIFQKVSFQNLELNVTVRV